MKIILTPFLLALLMAYLVNPLIAFFELRGIRRETIVVFFYLGVVSCFALGVTAVFPRLSSEIEDLQTSWPERVESLKKVTIHVTEYAAKRFPNGQEITRLVKDKINKSNDRISAALPDLILNLLSFISLLILVPFVAFFFLCDGPNLMERLLASCPSKHVERVLHIFCAISESLGDYLRALIVDSAIIGVLATLGLFALKMEYALILGVLAGVAGLVPYVGPLAVGGISVALAMVQFHDPRAAVNVIILFTGLRFVDDWLLQPYIMRRAVNLHPVLLLLALMIGGHLFGVLGLVFAAPTACALRVIFKTLVEWYMTESGLKKPPALLHEQVIIV